MEVFAQRISGVKVIFSTPFFQAFYCKLFSSFLFLFFRGNKGVFLRLKREAQIWAQKVGLVAKFKFFHEITWANVHMIAAFMHKR